MESAEFSEPFCGASPPGTHRALPLVSAKGLPSPGLSTYCPAHPCGKILQGYVAGGLPCGAQRISGTVRAQVNPAGLWSPLPDRAAAHDEATWKRTDGCWKAWKGKAEKERDACLRGLTNDPIYMCALRVRVAIHLVSGAGSVTFAAAANLALLTRPSAVHITTLRCG